MAETATGTIDSYDLTVETKINIDELIRILNYDDLPMLGSVNSDGLPSITRVPVDNTIFYWQSQTMPVPRARLNADINNAVTSVVLAAGDGVKFAEGDAIRVDNEFMFITAVATDTLTVVRGSAGSTAAAHTAAASDVIGIGTVLDEGDVGTQQFTGRDKSSNYTQIWTSDITMTRTGQVIPKYGVPSELGNLTAQVMLSEAINMEQSFLYGKKWQSDPRRMTGGLDFFLTSNRIANGVSGDWLTVTEVQKRQQVAYNKGGMFHRIVGNPAIFEALNNIAGNERVRLDWDDAYRGRQRATAIVTEYGEVMLHRNRHARLTDAFGVNTEDLIARVMQPMIMQPLAKTGDRDRWMFVAEQGWEVKGESHQVMWTGLDVTAALPASGV